MEPTILEILAAKHDLKIINTTSESNGYPCALMPALIWFENFEQAQKIADQNNLSIEFFEKKDGWQLYYRTGNPARKAIGIDSYLYGDDYSTFNNDNLDREHYEECMEYARSEEEKEYLEAQFKELIEEFQKKEPGEIIITRRGDYYDTVEKESMFFYEDGTTIVIGLIQR